jgi:hypothetical protein
MKLAGLLGRTGRDERPGYDGPLPAAGSRVRVQVLPSGVQSSGVQSSAVRGSDAAEDGGRGFELSAEVVRVETAGTTPAVLVAGESAPLPPLPAGARHRLAWTTDRELVVVPVDICPEDAEHWALTPCGPAQRMQRREYVRVRVDLPAQLQPDVDAVPGGEDPGEPAVIEGNLVDLGEGGARCVVPEPGLPDGARLTLAFDDPDGERLVVPAAVVRRMDLPGTRGHVSLALRFTDPELHGETVRRLVFAEQLRLLKWQRQLDA